MKIDHQVIFFSAIGFSPRSAPARPSKIAREPENGPLALWSGGDSFYSQKTSFPFSFWPFSAKQPSRSHWLFSKGHFFSTLSQCALLQFQRVCIFSPPLCVGFFFFFFLSRVDLIDRERAPASLFPIWLFFLWRAVFLMIGSLFSNL